MQSFKNWIEANGATQPYEANHDVLGQIVKTLKGLSNPIEQDYQNLIQQRAMSLDPSDPVYRAYHDIAKSILELSKQIKTSSRQLIGKIMSHGKDIARADDYYRQRKYVPNNQPKPARRPEGESSPITMSDPNADHFSL